MVYAFLKGLDGFDSLVNISELHVAFVSARGHLLDRSLKDLLRLLLVLRGFEEVGIAHGEHFVMGILVVGEGVEVLSLFVVE